MSRTLETDVAVVGTGPVGLTVANLLADQGVGTMLVERNPTVADEPRAISITDESLRVMSQIGILEALAPEMLMDTGTRYFGRKGQLLAEVKARVPRLGHPAKSQFDQPVLAMLLLKAVQSRPIDLRFDTELSNVSDRAEGVEFDITGPDGLQHVRAKWLIACDGGRSPVRTQLGIALEGSTQVEKWIVVDVLNSPGTPEPFAVFHCNGVRPCVVVPGVKGRCRYEFMVLPGDDLNAVISPDFIVRLVAPYQRIQPADIRRAAVYMAQQRIACQYRHGHVVLAGDAAHLMPPFAGQGLNSGVRDAANLAWKIAACVKGEARAALIDTYESERRPHASDMVRLSYRIGKVVMSTQPVLTALRDHVISAMRFVPTAKQWVVGMKFLKQPHFTVGCVVTPATDVPVTAAELVGRSLSQPRVRRADGSVAPLDAVIANGWSLLRFTEGSNIEIQQRLDVNGRLSRESVSDMSGAFAALHGSGVLLVIRPDRYVAAAAANGPRAGEALDELSRFLPLLKTAFALGDRAASHAVLRPILEEIE